MAAANPMASAIPIIPSRSPDRGRAGGKGRRRPPAPAPGPRCGRRASRNQNATNAPPNHTSAAAVSQPSPAASSGNDEHSRQHDGTAQPLDVAPVEPEDEEPHQRADGERHVHLCDRPEHAERHHRDDGGHDRHDPPGDVGEPQPDAGSQAHRHARSERDRGADEDRGLPAHAPAGRRREAHEEGHDLAGHRGRGQLGHRRRRRHRAATGNRAGRARRRSEGRRRGRAHEKVVS
jgi:hypothetical protein